MTEQGHSEPFECECGSDTFEVTANYVGQVDRCQIAMTEDGPEVVEWGKSVASGDPESENFECARCGLTPKVVIEGDATVVGRASDDSLVVIAQTRRVEPEAATTTFFFGATPEARIRERWAAQVDQPYDLDECVPYLSLPGRTNLEDLLTVLDALTGEAYRSCGIRQLPASVTPSYPSATAARLAASSAGRLRVAILATLGITEGAQ